MINPVISEFAKKVNPYSREIEELLIKKAQAGNIKSRNKLIESHLKFVIKVANSYHKKMNRIPVNDLVNEGIIGLIDSIYDFNFEKVKKVKFITYASFHIKKKITYYITNKSRLIRSYYEWLGVYRGFRTAREGIRGPGEGFGG